MRVGYENYDPNGIGFPTDNFLGLPRVSDAAVRMFAVAYDATVSSSDGTAHAPARILEESRQLDVCLPNLERPWEIGFDWQPLLGVWSQEAGSDRLHAAEIIDHLEQRKPQTAYLEQLYERITNHQSSLYTALKLAVEEAISEAVFPVVVGGDHSVPLGAYQACASFGEFGIVQLDAHMDLRKAYEGFSFSHASIMHNALKLDNLVQLHQVGIRDWCPTELERSHAEGPRVLTVFMHQLQDRKLEGEAFAKTTHAIVDALPAQVWLSIDVDGLDPAFCPTTGTPVPGGLSFAEARYLLLAIIHSGRRILGLDVVETGNAAYDANVSARLIYELAANAVTANRLSQQ